jgi:triacylglycerol esterase/lipase EstA (alpha/beta hydrolase family)
MGIRKLFVSSAMALLLASALPVTPVGAADGTPFGAARGEALTYAPVDRPGPELRVPAAVLAQSLSCTGDLTGSDRAPVLLVPGTWMSPREHYGWNYMRAFDALGWPYCAVTTPKHAMEDMQLSAEYVVYAIRSMYHRAGRPIAILGGSQGGTLPRWALRFWPDTRQLVEEHIGLAPPNHGGQGVVTLCTPDCAPALWQLLYQSEFMRALNSGQETFPGISYTEIYSHQDQTVTPAFDDTGTSSLHGGGGHIVNVALQDVCPVHFAEHIKAITYDAVGYALAIDALTHDGPADPARIDRRVCDEEFHPGVEPATFPANYLNALATAMYRQATVQRVDREPPLRPYVTGP